MARFKVLGSVAHNFGHSFTSLMNYRADDYVMGHLVARSFGTRAPELHIDVLSGRASPPELLSAPISDAVRDYCQWFPKLVASHQSSLELVRRAEMSLKFDLSSAWQEKVSGSVHAPYLCRVLIEDSRGRAWTAELRGSWYSEPPSKNLAPSRWIAARQAFAQLVDQLRGRTHPPGSASATA